MKASLKGFIYLYTLIIYLCLLQGNEYVIGLCWVLLYYYQVRTLY